MKLPAVYIFFSKGVGIVNAPKADNFSLSEAIEPVSSADADLRELTEAEISLVVGGEFRKISQDRKISQNRKISHD